MANTQQNTLPDIRRILERAENMSREAWRQGDKKAKAGGTFATIALVIKRYEHDEFYANALRLIVQATIETVKANEVRHE